MKLWGEFGPNQLDDGYIPGAWDEVRRAVMEGHVSSQAYEVLLAELGDRVRPRNAGEDEA